MLVGITSVIRAVNEVVERVSIMRSRDTVQGCGPDISVAKCGRYREF